uniref:Ig-like domain-containing protein n=1 Tax=Acinetobacter rudis TaxID=632955 RepID=UPI0033419E87
MADIKVVAKGSHDTLATLSGTSVKLKEPSVVLIKVSPNDVLEVKREGTSVVIHLKNGEVIIIEDFFSETAATDNSLVFGDESDQLIWARFTNDEGLLLDAVNYQPLENIEPLLYGDNYNPLAWAAIPVTAGGILAWADSGSNSNKEERDTTAPDAPTDVKVSKDGSTVTGKGEAGAEVIVKDKDGKIIGKGTVDKDGNFIVKLDPPLTNGEEIKVSLKDPAGNESGETIVHAPDTTAPDAPTDVKVSEDGSKVTGKGEAGAEVIVKDKDGKVIGKGTVDENGNFEVKLDPALTNGEEIKVSLKDPAGNESGETVVTAPDTTAPDAPTDVKVSED